MKLEKFSAEELKHLSMIELAHAILSSKQAPVAFEDMREEIAATLGLSEENLLAKLSQFYTDLNIDGRFICLGDNRWGLRSWYPYEQIDEEVLPQTKVKPKKKRAKKYDDDEDLAEEVEDGFDDVDEVELEGFDEEDEDDEEDTEELLEDDLLDEDDFELDEELLEEEEELDEDEEEEEEEI